MIPRGELLQVKRIASRVNPRIKEWAALADRKGREASNLTLADGARLVLEGLDPRLNPEPRRLRPATLIVSDSGAAHQDAGHLFQLAASQGIERVSVADDCFQKISSLKNSDGIALTLLYDPNNPDPATLLPKKQKWLAADNVQDPGNAGALARTALAAGCDGCLFLGGADPLSPKFLRGSMGACYRLPCHAVSLETFADALNASDAKLLVADSEDNGIDFRQADYSGSIIIAIGGERGISNSLTQITAQHIHIPLQGQVESLNLAVAAGVILFEAARQWRQYHV